MPPPVRPTPPAASSPRPQQAPPQRLGPALDEVHERLIEAMRRAIPLLPAEMQEDVAALISPENLAITAGVLGAWAASHAVGVGEVVDLGLIALGLLTLGAMALDVAKHVGEYLRIAAGANSPKVLDDAAAHLAAAISLLGVTLFAALIMKHAAKHLPTARMKLTLRPVQRYLALTVEEWLYKAGHHRIAPRTRACAEKALQFCQGKRNHVSERDVLEWLKAMDLSTPSGAPFGVVTLPPSQTLIGYLQLRPTVVAKIKANPQRAREFIAALTEHDVEIGRFFTRPGTPIQQLGIADQNRVFVKFELGAQVSALESTTLPVRDTWTVRNTRTITLPNGNAATQRVPQLVGGGGKQYLIPDARYLYFTSKTFKIKEIGTNIKLY